MRYFTINVPVPLSCSAKVGPLRLSSDSLALLASRLGAVPRHEAVISPVKVNLAAGELSRWLPADYSLVSRSSCLSPAELDAGETWTMTHPTPSHPTSQSSKKPRLECKEQRRGEVRVKREIRWTTTIPARVSSKCFCYGH